MHIRTAVLTLVAAAALALGRGATPIALAPGPTDIGLTGVVSSPDEGAMEGVLVSARKMGSTQTITVASDQQGRYRFPAAKLDPGQYLLKIRAIGYDLVRDTTVSIVPDKPTDANLKLRKTDNLASQLTNAEWLASFPGSDDQKASIHGCAHCHTLELVSRSHHDADAFMKVFERMAGYPPLAFPLMPQRTPAPRIGGGEVSAERQQQTWRRQAEYLSGLNLSSGPRWIYPFKTLPRPAGAATRVIYTDYALPQKTRQPHDVIVDWAGVVW